MSIIDMDSKIKELRELRRMADELTAEMESITDSNKRHMERRGRGSPQRNGLESDL